jgi:ligand-binding SRPBCC domain-containing protein
MHHLEWNSFVPVSIERVWAFFSDPAHLPLLTPPEMRLSLVGGEAGTVRQGSLIEFRLRLLGLSLPWTSRIDVWEPGRRFVDVQVRGPYRHWRHEHIFRSVHGGTCIQDRVDYAIPLAALGRLLHRAWIRSALERIFGYRSRAVARLLTDEAKAPPTPGSLVPT